jgi:hypothetical protein
LFPDRKGCSDSEEEDDYAENMAAASIAEDGEEEPPIYISGGRMAGGHYDKGADRQSAVPGEHLDAHANGHHKHSARDGEEGKVEVEEVEEEDPDEETFDEDDWTMIQSGYMLLKVSLSVRLSVNASLTFRGILRYELEEYIQM